MNWNRLLQPDLIWVLIPVSAIVVGGILGVLRQLHRHQERQALIEQGIHPDFAPDETASRRVPPARERP